MKYCWDIGEAEGIIEELEERVKDLERAEMYANDVCGQAIEDMKELQKRIDTAISWCQRQTGRGVTGMASGVAENIAAILRGEEPK